MSSISRTGFLSKGLIERDLQLEFERKGLNYSDLQMKLWVRATERIAMAAYNKGFITGRKTGGKKN